MPRFEREEDHRFWEIHLEADEKTVHSRAGFIGTDGKPSNKKTWDTKKDAAAELKTRITEQLEAGYVELKEWSEPATPELLEAIGANPTDVTGYLVYSDWLLGKKHPRGELIVLQSQLGSARTDKKLLAAEAKLLEKHGAKLAPPRCSEASIKTRHKRPPLATSELRWENGFIASARLCRFSAEQPWTIRDLMCELLSHPAGRFLRRLELGVRGDTKKNVSYRDAIGDLARLAPASLRSLSVVEAPRDSAALAFSELGPLDEMLAAMPSLESLGGHQDVVWHARDARPETADGGDDRPARARLADRRPLPRAPVAGDRRQQRAGRPRDHEEAARR
ncbi:MAG: TIGR02996 domain-containing protein [Archangium sp.]